MCNILHQSSMKEENETVVLGRQQTEGSNRKAIENSTIIPHTASLENVPNINTENVVIPFEANFDEEDIPDFDFRMMLSEFEDKNTNKIPTKPQQKLQ